MKESDKNIINVLALQMFQFLFNKDSVEPEDEDLDCALTIYEEHERIMQKKSKLSSTNRQKITNFVAAMERDKKCD